MTWPIDSLTIHRFRGLADLALPGLGRINLLVGENNSGKTSVLEAVSLYCKPLDPLAWRSLARRRVRGFRSISAVEGVTWLFPHAKQGPADRGQAFSSTIAIEGNGRDGARTLRATLREVEEVVDPGASPKAGPASEREGYIGRGADVDCELLTAGHPLREEMQFRDYARPVRRPAPSRKATLGCELISPYDHGLEEIYTRKFRNAVLDDSKNDVLAALQRIDPGILDMEFLPLAEPGLAGSEGALYLLHARSGRTPLSAFGDGVRRVLLMALALVSASHGDLLIDEIETAIHVSVLGQVFRWLVDSCERHDVQLFATTHSLEALDAILAADKERLASVVGYRFPPAEHPGPPKRFEGEQLSRLRLERGLDVR